MIFDDYGGVVALLGNGVSLVYSPQLSCDSLAQILDAELAAALGGSGLNELKNVGKTLLADGQIGASSFEGLLGPLDRLGDALQGMERLTSIGGGSDLDRKYRDVREHVRNLYLTGTSKILTQVATHTRKNSGSAAWALYKQFADWLIDISGSRVLRCFTLNYDVLLDAAFLDHRSAGSIKFFSDQADGSAAIQQLPLTSGLSLEAVPLRLATTADYVPEPERGVVLHHLHGSVQWVRSGTQVFKATQLESIRNLDPFMAGVEPVVVLTDRKTHAIDRWPFSDSYAKLGGALRRATGVVIAGYGWGDVPVNAAVCSALHQRCSQNQLTTIAIFTNKSRAEMLRLLGGSCDDSQLGEFLDRSVTCIPGHLPGALTTYEATGWQPF